jgi:putative transposase
MLERETFHESAQRKDIRIVEEHICPDHMLIEIPPKHAVSQTKGKSAVSIARTYMGRKKNFMGKNLGKRIVCVNGRAGWGSIKKYIHG